MTKQLHHSIIENRIKNGVKDFKIGERVWLTGGTYKIGKSGIVKSLRDSEYERKHSKYTHYIVDFDDGTFETYQSKLFMLHEYEIKI